MKSVIVINAEGAKIDITPPDYYVKAKQRLRERTK